ncbi:c-type cytochrome domain-containing protein [Lunatibacter salilacus]|uniref:c-type cytochrome domain-containing protein n=1 Tax=Lunatibacter salilacus TaxID=2483804 RepID=UPI001F2E21FD|nr:c-type cytochrome domain-containing protein [Lunatibacter salilacus]
MSAFFLSVPFLPETIDNDAALPLLIGRFHPLVLHFPIVLILLTSVFLILGIFHALFRHPLVIGSLLFLSCVSSAIAVVAGYLLFATDDYSGDMVLNHLWGGIWTGVGICLSSAVYVLWLEKNSKILSYFFYTALGATTAFLGYTSHLGGSLTHGQDFISEPMTALFPPKGMPEKPLEEVLLYEDLIYTILDSKCINCHNENKTKGDLLMTSHDNLIKAGESGKNAVIPGNSAESELMVRVHLPSSDEDHMPPEGKPGFSAEELKLLTFWIDEGAEKNIKIVELLDHPEVGPEINILLPKIRKTQQRLFLEKEKFEQVYQELLKIAEPLGIEIMPDKDAEQLTFALRMTFPPKPFSTEELLKLEPYFSFFSSVSLASADITDDELFFISKMENLRHLFVQKTGITGTGLPYLHSLSQLETLNISFTPMIDGNALHLLEFPALKKIYFFGTPVKKEVIAALQAYRPDLEIVLEEGPLF